MRGVRDVALQSERYHGIAAADTSPAAAINPAGSVYNPRHAEPMPMAVSTAKDMLEAGARAHRAGRLDEAAELYRRVLTYDAGNRAALANLGLLLGEMREYAPAEALLRRLTREQPGHVEGHASLAAILHDQNRFDEAIAACERGLALAPDHRKLLNTLASSLTGAGRYDEAIALLERMVRAHPQFAQGHRYLGTIYTKLGRCDEAVAAFDRATALEPGEVAADVGAAEVLMLNGRAAEALARLDRALGVAVWDVRALALKVLALAELGRTDEERWLADPQRLVRTIHLRELGYTAEQIGMLNRALSAFATDEPSMREDPPEYATKKGWHTTVNLAEAENEGVDVLKRFIAYAFERRLKALPEEDPAHPFVRGAPPRFHLDLWAVKMASGGKMLPHIHADGWLSGVYYVDVPAVVDDPAAGEAGWLKIGTPRADIRLTRPTLTRTVKPEPGLIVTFPSYLWHDTVPLPESNTEQRLCLAFDLHPIRR